MTEADIGGMPLVSVIIPTYNRIGTLPRAVDSVLGQTYGNLELIVVDDGSTDGTEEYVRGLTDGRVRYVKGDGNRGPAAARNLGVRQAQGGYVAFQDSDDEWHSDKLEKQMPLLLDAESGYDMVYCEFTRYYKQTKRELVPSKRIPAGCKQGDMLAVLLLQPLISPTTMVMKKHCFMQSGGFLEKLKTFEDYEFTLRFSQNHSIGFVEESLVRVYDSPNSVDKRYADRIRTQAYIVREMIGPLKEYGFLWEKLSAIQRVADRLKCHDVFLEELRLLADLFVTEQDRINAAELVEKTERSDAKQNQRKETAYRALAHGKQQILQTYMGIYRDEIVDNAGLDRVLQQMSGSVADCGEAFKISSVLCRDCSRTFEARDSSTKLERLSLLADVVKTVEELERWIIQQRIECNVCGSTFFINESHKCPYCEAEDWERLLVSFLQKLQPEAGEMLNMLQIMPSRLLSSYALNRMDIYCESLETAEDDGHALQGIDGEQYDILLCSAFSEQTYYSGNIWRELFRVMKSEGICLLSPSLESGGQAYVKWLDSMGFYVNVIGENWFGEEFYRTHGFDSQMNILVLTKGRVLTEM